MAAGGECPQVAGEDPAFAGMVTVAIVQGPSVAGPAGTTDCRPGTALKIRASGKHGLAVSLVLDDQVVGKRQLDFATEPKPFDAAEAVALAYREMATNLATGVTRLTSSPVPPPSPARITRPTSEGDRQKRRAANPKGSAPADSDDQAEEVPPAPPTAPPPINVAPAPLPRAIQSPPALAETLPWSLSLAATLVRPEIGPARIGPTIDLGRDMGRWWVAHVTARLAPLRVGAKRQDNRGDVRQYSL
ncbi:MAG TPA: hypothetical protein VF518_00915, partial [Polyangia bacterium]